MNDAMNGNGGTEDMWRTGEDFIAALNKFY